MAGEKTGSKADTLVKVVLVFFISLLSFSVGTFVGKQVSDSDRRTAALEGEYSKGHETAAADEHGAHEGEEKISEKEVEALTEEFVNREKADRQPAEAVEKETMEVAAHEAGHAESPATEGYKAFNRKGSVEKATAEKHAADKAHEAPAATQPKSGETKPAPKAEKHGMKDDMKAITEKVAEGKAPTDGKAEDRKPAAVLPSVAASAIGKYTVQVASYADEKEAKTHAADLKGKGYNAFYLPATVSGRTWFRVLVGLFSNQEAAKQYRAQFMKEANTKAAIVQKIVQ